MPTIQSAQRVDLKPETVPLRFKYFPALILQVFWFKTFEPKLFRAPLGANIKFMLHLHWRFSKPIVYEENLFSFLEGSFRWTKQRRKIRLHSIFLWKLEVWFPIQVDCLPRLTSSTGYLEFQIQIWSVLECLLSTAYISHIQASAISHCLQSL